MENQSIKEKIFYWGRITLISSVIIGGAYYIYKSIFGSDEEEKNIIDIDNDSVGNSSILNNKNNINNNNINNNNINNETSLGNSISNNIKSTIFEKQEKNIIENEDENNNIINTKSENIDNQERHDNQIPQMSNPKHSINIFNSNNKIFLKSFGINLDESKLFNNNNRLTEEGTIHLIIIMEYLSKKFYLIDNPTLDQKRRALLRNINNINNAENNMDESNIINIREINEEYLALCSKTLEIQQNTFQLASEKILASLSIKINYQEIEEFLKNNDPKLMEKIQIKLTLELNDEIFKYDLDFMDINKTKEAYIFYLKISIEYLKKVKEQQEKIIINENQENEMMNEEHSILLFQMMTNKIRMNDILYEKYHIEEEHLKLLVNKYNLFEDDEIIQLKKEWEEIEKTINKEENIQ